jgi:hypothetical protein
MQPQVMQGQEFFLLLGALLESRRAAFKRRCTIAFAVVDDGPYFVDTAAQHLVEKKWRRDANVSVLTNQRTLSDMIAGRFDVQKPLPEHLFLWGGDREVWEAFARAFTGTTSTLGVQIAALSRGKDKER